MAGRTLAKLDAVAKDISTAGGVAETAEVDALDEQAVNKHADAVAAKAGGIDIALNAVGILHVQGTPFVELSFQDYAHPITAYTRTHFLTAKAVARHMVKQGSGVILTLSTPGSRMTGQGFMGYGVTCGAIETFSRILAGERLEGRFFDAPRRFVARKFRNEEAPRRLGEELSFSGVRIQSLHAEVALGAIVALTKFHASTKLLRELK